MGHPIYVLRTTTGGRRFVLSHPWRKDKDAPRWGTDHLSFVRIDGAPGASKIDRDG
jgi:hypothetical protein